MTGWCVCVFFVVLDAGLWVCGVVVNPLDVVLDSLCVVSPFLPVGLGGKGHHGFVFASDVCYGEGHIAG